jgi:nuclear GTP-binding protein
MIAKKRGKLGKGGEAHLNVVAIMVLNDWSELCKIYLIHRSYITCSLTHIASTVRGRIPYFVRPPDSTRFADAQGSDAAKTEEALKAQGKEFGEGRVPGVVQPLHQIVSRTRYLDVDSDKVNAPPAEKVAEADVSVEGDQTAEVIENDLDDGEDDEEVDDDDEEGEDEDQDASVAWEDLVGESSAAPPTSSPGKKRQVEDADLSDDEDGRKKGKKQVKEPRMKTNKKKAENFFTHANVKNKNRERKIPRLEGKKKAQATRGA